MKFGAMLTDVLKSLVTPVATKQYPVERVEAPLHLRGRLTWDPENCIGCNLCAKDCPANALELITLDKKAKRFVIRYHVDRCIFCNQCVSSCRKECLDLSHEEWELAALDRNGFIIDYGEEEDIVAAHAQLAAAAAEAAAST